MMDRDLTEFYETGYSRGAGLAAIPQDDDWMYGQVLQQIRPYLRAGLAVLDLGCNNGNLSLYMARAGCQVLGIDIAQQAIETARMSAAHYGITNACFEKRDFLREWNEPQAFDLILCSRVLEHIPEDGLAMSKLAWALRANGRLLLLAPMTSSSLYKLSLALSGQFAHDQEVGHLRRYTRASLTRLVEQAGFQIDKVLFLDSVLRDWFILYKPLRRFNRLWSRPVIRVWFNRLDSLLARFMFPATICVHARRRG